MRESAGVGEHQYPQSRTSQADSPPLRALSMRGRGGEVALRGHRGPQLTPLPFIIIIIIIIIIITIIIIIIIIIILLYYYIIILLLL